MRLEDKKERDILLYKIWEEFKGEYSMRDLSELLDIHLQTLYKCLYRGRKYEKENNVGRGT